jgi:hypothetical protein
MAMVAIIGGTIIGVAAWSRRKRELTGDTAMLAEAKVPDDPA